MTLGLDSALAQQAMESEGFRGFSEGETESGVRYLSCDRQDSIHFMVTRRWMVSLIFDNENRVASVHVSSGLIGP